MRHVVVGVDHVLNGLAGRELVHLVDHGERPRLVLWRFHHGHEVLELHRHAIERAAADQPHLAGARSSGEKMLDRPSARRFAQRDLFWDRLGWCLRDPAPERLAQLNAAP